MSTTVSFPEKDCNRSQIEFKIANTWEERSAAFRLVYQSYLRSGLGTHNPFGMRVTPYHLLATTETFIAVVRGEVAATMGLVIAGDLGLPMESVFPEEVAIRRAAGIRLGEVTCLADRRAEPRGLLPMMLGLGRLMAQFARRAGMDELLAAVHPTHARFYRRYMHFVPIAGERAYPSVCDQPAEAVSLNFAYVQQHPPKCYESFLGNELPDETFTRLPMSRAEIAYFGRVARYTAARVTPSACESESCHSRS